MSPTFAALAHPQYRRYLLAQFATGIGFWMMRLAQDWLVLELTGGSGTAVGIATAMQFIPLLVITPWAGVLADRFSRRNLMIGAHIGLVLTSLVLLITLLTNTVSVPVLFVLAAITGVMAAIDQPARQAVVGELVGDDHLVNAVALNSVAFNLARIAGPAAAGLLIAGAGVPAVVGVIAAMFAVAFGALVSLHRIPRDGAQSGPRATLAEGIAYLKSEPPLAFVLGLIFFVALFGLNFQLTIALMATAEFGGGAASLGILSTFLALGSLVGSLLAARRTRIRLRVVITGALTFGVATLAAGVMPTWTFFAIALPLCGVTAMTFTTAAQSFVQLATPDRLRGRVMGIYTMLFFAGTPVGAPLIGWLSDLFGARVGLIGGGIGVLVSTVILSLALHLFRRARRDSQSLRGIHP